MSHISESPLTAIKFFHCGKKVALGTIDGEVLIHDLRRITTPIQTIKASSAPIHSIMMQPKFQVKLF